MRIAIIAHPNAKNPSASLRTGPRIETDLLGTLHVYVSEPPLEGRANRGVIRAIAEHFKVKENKVVLISGEKSKNKVLEILA